MTPFKKSNNLTKLPQTLASYIVFWGFIIFQPRMLFTSFCPSGLNDAATIWLILQDVDLYKRTFVFFNKGVNAGTLTEKCYVFFCKCFDRVWFFLLSSIYEHNMCNILFWNEHSLVSFICWNVMSCVVIMIIIITVIMSLRCCWNYDIV